MVITASPVAPRGAARTGTDRHLPANGRWAAEEPYAFRRDRLPKVVASLPRRPDNLRAVLRDEVVAAGLLHLLRPDDPGILVHLRNAARAAGAAARLLGPDAPRTVAVSFGGAGGEALRAEVPRAAPGAMRFDRAAFTDGFHAAMAARDGDALDALAALPDATLDAASEGAEEAPTAAPRVRALRGLRRRDVGFPDALLAWLRATDPAALPAWAIPHALEVDAPEIGMIHALRSDAAANAFDVATAKALERHEVYWTASEEARNDFRGLLALGPLAHAVLARDMGIRVATRSDYLPISVVEAGTA